ncbi:acyl-CoA dehydrogenase family protein [Nonomuraea sp. C10]|uniref:acyl-CoA dehydrogenase family protein n=1 Tax=Nonomuraea sp. C10 TaxID=2600577 RepID=UPI0011CDB457|nr:acyl-CoA dehydrogenase family protein [Nonomuraea sp. C10]TXK40295.1 acyl-CoA dehydrogenase [Nonomuraea sp. C10]
MSLIFTDDQKSLAETVRHFVAQRTPLPKVREVIGGDQAYDQEVWSRLAGDLGLAGLTIPEEYGGAGATQADLSAALRELGAGLVPSPLLACVLTAGALLALDDEEAKREVLPRIAEGALVGALAVSEPGNRRWIPADPETTATGSGDAVTLSGAKVAVLNGAEAGVLLVQARGPQGVGLYLVERSAGGLTVTKDEVVDPTRSSATVTLDGAPARLVAGDAVAALDRVADLANLAIASEQCGAMLACLTMTTEYAKVRYAFGQPIGAYQGVKHKLADMYNLWALADAALREATRAADEEPAKLGTAAAAARTLSSPGYLTSAKETMLLHGGIGFTWEHDAHFFYKNAIAGNVLAGDADYQQDRLADKLGV